MNGLYEIIHQPTGRAYIGSSVDVERRLKAHRAMLRRGIHDNRWLQRTWARDGEDAFVLRALEECDEARLREREAEVIAARRPDVFNLSEVVRRGARAGNASMTDDEAREIYRRAGEGVAVADLADVFGFEPETVRRIVFGRTYLHITGGKPARAPQKARGPRSANAKLTDDQVREIRRRYRDGRTLRGPDGRVVAGHPDSGPALAREFGVSEHLIYLVRSRKSWAHID